MRRRERVWRLRLMSVRSSTSSLGQPGVCCLWTYIIIITIIIIIIIIIIVIIVYDLLGCLVDPGEVPDPEVRDAGWPSDPRERRNSECINVLYLHTVDLKCGRKRHLKKKKAFKIRKLEIYYYMLKIPLFDP